jgi:HK97 family phage major capsid protein
MGAFATERAQVMEKMAAQFATLTEIRERLHKTEDARKAEVDTEFNRAYEEFVGHKRTLDQIETLIQFEDKVQADKDEAENRRLFPQHGFRRKGPEADAKKEAHKRAFDVYLRSPAHETNALGRAAEQLKGYGPEEMNALLGTNDELGGFTIPEDFRAELLRALPGFAAVRQAGARIVPTSRQIVVFPTVKSGTDPYSSGITNNDEQATGGNMNWKPQGYVTGGTVPPQQDQPQFGQERIPVHVWQPNAVELSRELLDDSVFPLETILAQLFAETKALDEDWAFLNGDGVGKPEGILNAGCATVNVGNPITYNGLVDLYYTLRAQYRTRSAWMMSSLVFAEIVKLNTGAGGMLIFPPNAPPNTLFGRTVHFTEFLPNPGAANKVILLGEFSHYIVAERSEMRINRLVERFAPNIGVLPHARLGGQLTRKEAFRIGVQS